jgi:hypothetical protein
LGRRQAAVDLHFGALNHDPRLRTIDKAAARANKRNAAGGLEHNPSAGLQVDIAAGLQNEVASGLFVDVLPDVQRHLVLDVLVETALHRAVLVAFHHFDLVALDLERAVADDHLHGVVLRRDLHIFLRVNYEQLIAFGIDKPQFVELGWLAVLGAASLDAAPVLVIGQLVWRVVHVVVQTPRDHRPVGVSLQKLHNHLLPHARQPDMSESQA